MAGGISIQQALNNALESGASTCLEAEILLSAVLNRPRSHLHARPEARLNTRQSDLFSQYIERRRRGEPVAYITGTREFWSSEFSVTADTLIPRPETELLVQTALTLGDAVDRPVSVIDLGTGTGCIALSLALERPDWRIVATDISASALDVARGNADALGVGNVRLIQSDWFEAVEGGGFDLVIANPPYVPAGDPHLQQGDVRFEPRVALAAGSHGLDAIHLLLAQACSRLARNGYLLLEIGYDQAEKVRSLARECGYADPRMYNDDIGIPRVFVAPWNACLKWSPCE